MKETKEHSSQKDNGQANHQASPTKDTVFAPIGVGQLQRAVANPRSVRPEVLLELNHRYGNRAVQRLLQRQNAKPTKNIVQRLNTDETFYVSQFDDDYGRSFLKKPLVTTFLALLENYGNFYNNITSRQTIDKMQLMLKSLKAKADELIPFNEQLTQELSTKFADNPDNLRRITHGSSSVKKILIHTLLDDLSQESAALQKLKADQNYLTSGLDMKTALYMTRAGVPFNQIKTNADLLQGGPTGVPGEPRVLGGGQMTPVTKLTYAGGQERVFKPNENKAGDTVRSAMGDGNIQSTLRVLAVGRVQTLIQQKLQQANAQAESLLGNIDPALYTPQGSNKALVGTATDFAPGMEGMEADLTPNGAIQAQHYLNTDFNDVKLKRQMYNLQLMDIIVGQVDRHMGNVKVSQALQPDQNTKATGIDNDFAFPGEKNMDDSGELGKTRLPGLVDEAFATAILALTEDEFWQAMQGLRLSEKSLALQRFKSVQQHLTQLQGNNQLIALPGQPRQQRRRDWGQIGKDDFHQGGRWNQSDYMAQLAEGPIKAYDAIKQNPTNVQLQPKQINRKNRQEWVIEYEPSLYLTARDQTQGTDLWDLYNRAVAEANRQNQPVWANTNVGGANRQPQQRAILGGRGARVRNNVAVVGQDNNG